MNIWIINQYAIPPDQAGITRHYSFARQLIKRGHQVTLIASSFDHVLRKETRLNTGETFKLETIEGVSFLWLRTPPYPGNDVRRIWNMLVFAGKIWRGIGTAGLRDPDVIVGSSPHLFGAFAACRLAKRKRVPFVLEVRDLWPQSLIDLGNVSAIHPMVLGLELVEKYLYRNSDRIISVLPGALEYILGKGGKRERVVWLPNGVDLSQVPSPPAPKGNGKLAIMYAGTIGMANGLETVLAAAALLSKDGWNDRVVFKLVGDGPRRKALQQSAKEQRLEMVRFEGPVRKDEIYEVLQGADVFLMILKDSPVFRYGISPNKLFDYFASARPVLSGVTSPYNPVTEANAGFAFSPGDAGALSDAVKALHGLPPAERREIGLRGRRYVESHHDLSKLGEKLEKILLEVLRN